MGHQHHHHHKTSNITFVLFLNVIFASLEAVAGFLFNSTALVSDAVHDFGDAFILLLSAIMERISKKQANQAYSYGYQRLSIVGALINCTVLVVGSCLILQQAIERLLQPEPVVSLGMFVMSLFGITVNGYGTYKLAKSANILDKSVGLHLFEDLVGWIAVFVVSIVIYFTNWYILDPIVSIFIVGLILYNVYKMFKECFQLIMCATPDETALRAIQQQIEALEEVEQIESVHYWSLDGSNHIFTAKIKLSTASTRSLRQQVNAILQEYAVQESTIEWIEPH